MSEKNPLNQKSAAAWAKHNANKKEQAVEEARYQNIISSLEKIEKVIVSEYPDSRTIILKPKNKVHDNFTIRIHPYKSESVIQYTDGGQISDSDFVPTTAAAIAAAVKKILPKVSGTLNKGIKIKKKKAEPEAKPTAKMPEQKALGVGARSKEQLSARKTKNEQNRDKRQAAAKPTKQPKPKPAAKPKAKPKNAEPQPPTKRVENKIATREKRVTKTQDELAQLNKELEYLQRQQKKVKI
jgi:hypothetical protein